MAGQQAFFKLALLHFVLKLFCHLLVCLTSLFLSVSSTHSPHVINEIWSVMRDCRPFGVLHWGAAFNSNCSVCCPTKCNYFYYYLKILNDGEGRCRGGQVMRPVLLLNTDTTANTIYRSKPTINTNQTRD